jgi:protein-S-isoprenylcysteine O-methyltransferase Ste14
MTSRAKSFAMAAGIWLLLTGAPLVTGWGWADWRGFLASPARAGLLVSFVAVVLACATFGIEIHPLREGMKMARGTRSIWIAEMVMPAAWFLVGFCDRRGVFVLPESEWIRLAGLAAYVAGELVRLSALHTLGRHYSAYITVQREHRLVQTGLYRTIRHPFYLGQVLAHPGIALVFRSPLALIMAAASVPFVALRIRREEQFLLANLGPEYAEYQARSWRLLPHVY